jgi:hypothetical protein
VCTLCTLPSLNPTAQTVLIRQRRHTTNRRHGLQTLPSKDRSISERETEKNHSRRDSIHPRQEIPSFLSPKNTVILPFKGIHPATLYSVGSKKRTKERKYSQKIERNKIKDAVFFLLLQNEANIA